jgi:hypothetical protein
MVGVEEPRMSKGRNYHQEVIPILKGFNSLDKDAILFWIAQYHPSVFVAATGTGRNGEKEVIQFIRDGLKLNAIKCHREHNPGKSLLDSKNYVDGLAARLGL